MLEELSALRPAETVLARCQDAERCARLYRGILVRAALTIERGAVIMEALLGDTLQKVPAPERVLVHFDRFLEASLSPSGILEHFLRTPRLLSDYFLLISSSLWLADTMVRDAELFRWLLTSDALDAAPSHAGIVDAARMTMRRFDRPELRINALRRFQRRELLRIAAADLMGRKRFPAIVAELSALADAIVASALDESLSAVERRRGHSIDASIAVIALGKLGGMELNYSSDIDLMIVYRSLSSEGIANDDLPGMTGTHDDVIAVVKEMLRILTGSGSEGMLYRTDLRLRPDGAAGALALSLPASVTYYERRGAMWERQMLLRARCCAGEADLGDELLRRLEPFVHPRTLLRLPSALLADIRARLAARWSDEHDIKHMRGGIRHIEFSLQALQMLHAHRPVLRTPSTTRAIELLAREGLLQPEEEALLGSAYIFLRRIEHVLQLEHFEQTHTLPSDENDLRRVAWTLGFESAAAFARKLQQTRDDVDRICGGILRAAEESGGERADVLPPFPAEDARSRQLLHDIVEGRSSAPRSAVDRERLARLLPSLLQEIAALPLPAQILTGIEQFIHGTDKAGGVTFLENSRARLLLLRLAALAPVALSQLERDPLVLELVFSGWNANALDAVRLSRVASISALAALLLDDCGMDHYSRVLTDTADTVLRRALEKLNAGSLPFAVLALGKYGSAELIPGSDLDVILFYDAETSDQHEHAQQLARDLLKEMQCGVIPPLYDVDARLRPEGRSAPLAVTVDAWRQYLADRASLWERQSLLRARIAAGDSGLASRIMSVIDGVRAGTHLAPDDISAIRAMRLKMEPENRFRQPDFFDIKKSAGGLIDAEFAAQTLQLALPALKTGGTAEVLREAGDLLPELAEPIARLRVHYVFLRRLQLFFRLRIETPSNIFPVQREARQLLAAAMAMENEHTLMETLRRNMAAARRDLNSVLAAVTSFAAGKEQ